MKVHWTNTAERHLDAIFDFIVQDSPEYAKRMVNHFLPDVLSSPKIFIVGTENDLAAIG